MVPQPIPPLQPVYRQTNHVLHLLLSLFTAGLWLFVWPFVLMANNANNNNERERYQRELALYTQALQMYQQGQGVQGQFPNHFH